MSYTCVYSHIIQFTSVDYASFYPNHIPPSPPPSPCYWSPQRWCRRRWPNASRGCSPCSLKGSPVVRWEVMVRLWKTCKKTSNSWSLGLNWNLRKRFFCKKKQMFWKYGMIDYWIPVQSQLFQFYLFCILNLPRENAEVLKVWSQSIQCSQYTYIVSNTEGCMFPTLSEFSRVGMSR